MAEEKTLDFPSAIEKLSREKLLELKLALEAVIIELKKQIDDAMTKQIETGVYADRAWFSRVKDRLRVRQHQAQRVQTLIGVKGKQERAERLAQSQQSGVTDRDRRFFKTFMRLAKERMGEEAYKDLCEEAEALAVAAPKG